MALIERVNMPINETCPLKLSSLYEITAFTSKLDVTSDYTLQTEIYTFTPDLNVTIFSYMLSWVEKLANSLLGT